MSNNREETLWEELARLSFVAAIIAMLILAAVYLVLGGFRLDDKNTWNVARTLVLDIIANLIPVLLVFAGSYALFRRIQALRSDRETEEMVHRISLQVANILLSGLDVQRQNDLMTPAETGEVDDDLSRQVRRLFEITDKHFDDTSTPQRIVIQFTNRGSNVIRVKEVKYSDSSLGLPASALVPSYRKEGVGYYIIPFDQDKAEVLPGQSFLVELHLAQEWKRQDINRMAGDWGYLRIKVVYGDELTEVFQSI